MNTKTCDLCKCAVTPTYAMKHLHEFMDKVCEHESKLENLDLTGIESQLNSKLTLEIANTYSSITTSTNRRLILVVSDVNNSNSTGLYLHDGLTIKELLLL